MEKCKHQYEDKDIIRCVLIHKRKWLFFKTNIPCVLKNNKCNFKEN